VNRRILYNRASVDLSGKPYNVKKAVIYWNANAVLPDGKLGRWEGDVPTGRGPDGGREGGEEAVHHAGRRRGGDLRPGLKDGPFPEHYEPLECPVQENLMSKQRTNPASKMFSDGGCRRMCTRRATPGTRTSPRRTG